MAATGVGAVVSTVSPAAHDHLLAYLSHLPQLTVSALMALVGQAVRDPGLALAGRGLRQHGLHPLHRRQAAGAVGVQQLGRAQGGDHFLNLAAALSMASMWPSGFMLACTAATLPSGAIR